MTDVEKWLRVFCEPGQVVELRALGVGGRRAVCEVFGDLAALARRAAELDAAGAQGVYFTPNPLRPDLAGRKSSARKEDVARRHWLLIDVDPERPAGTSSTEAELADAWLVLDRCRGTLDGCGLAGAVVGCSGNGWHLCYPIDLPNDEASQELVKAVLKGLQSRCGGLAAKVDVSCHDAPRIWKLYGTSARKGEATAERPHRLAFLAEGEPWAQQTAAANTALLQPILDRWRWIDDSRKGRPAGDLVARAKAYLAKVDPAVSGKPANPPENMNHGHDQTYHVACVLVEGFGLNKEQALEAIQDWNKRCKPRWEKKDLVHKIESALGKVDSARLGHLVEAAAPETAPPPVDVSQPLVDRACDITPRAVEWLWRRVVPLGKLTTFAGVGGLGKTFVLCDITARVTTGAEWPMSEGERAQPGSVLFISGEDDPDDTLVPRLMEMGADLGRVTFLKSAVQSRFTLADLAVLRAALAQTGPDVRLVVIDPPTAYLGDVDDHKNSELRRLLAPLAALAQQCRVAAIFNTHVNKQAGKVDAMMRVMGSVAWVNAVRAAHLFVRDPDDPNRRFFLPMKMNLGRERKGLAYAITPTVEMARVDWLAEVDVTADEAMGRGSDRTPTPRQIDAEAFLRQLFEARTDIPAEEVWATAKQQRISSNALKEAKAALGIRAAQRALQDVGNVWFWIWPANHAGRRPPEAEDRS